MAEASSITQPSYQVADYTTAELFDILQLNPDVATPNDVIRKSNEYIDAFYTKGKQEESSFFEDIQTQLLQLYDQSAPEAETIPDSYEGNNAQTSEWITSQALAQDDDPIQNDKVTQRKQKIDIYDNESMPMKREQLGVSNQFDLPVAQGAMNPNLQNTMTRIVNLDSQFRYTNTGIDSGATDYTLDLSDTLKNVLNMRLYSFQIPFTWYVIDVHLGNTCMWIRFGDQSAIPINIPPGNYTQTSFTAQFIQSVTDAGFTGASVPITINENNGKVTINMFGQTYTDKEGVETIVDETTTLLFFDPSGEYTCNSGCNPQSHVIDGTLGWIMGYRQLEVYVYIDGNTSDAVIDLFGPKYFILAVDDYNQNRINNGLVTITELSNTLKIPAYYNTSQPSVCTGVIGSSRGREIVEPSAPRTITRAQIYTINEIVKNRENTTQYRGRAPTVSDTFAILAVKHNGLRTGDMYVEFAGALQDNKRIYFGPVDIERMRIRLLDDRGNIVNLNGSDWCVTILTEVLYQY